MYYELTNKRVEEKTLGYAESHDQALVGDQTIIFRLIGKEMYFSMDKLSENLQVDRGIALHKMIRLLTAGTAGNGYLNFMGNEFGHPEWIDFPRLGNNWSYQYARRQWSLVENKLLRYSFLDDFDKQMIKLLRENQIFSGESPRLFHDNTGDQVLAFERNNLFFIFNFSPVHSYPDYGLNASPSKYKVVLDTDELIFGGQGRIDHNYIYRTIASKNNGSGNYLKIYLPSRTGIVLRKEKIKGVYDTP
jgi:1,4-alpha-glucan branching enzyme